MRSLAGTMMFRDGKATNPDNNAKQNLQADVGTEPMQKASEIVRQAILRNEWVMDVCRPRNMAAPMVAKYEPGMHYGEHVDTPVIPGNPPVRIDISCTVFLSDPGDYEGGELVIRPGNRELKIKENAGSAVFYPSTNYHQVQEVTKGVRLVGLTFLESFIRDAHKRHILFELEELRHSHGDKLGLEGMTKLEFVRTNLIRLWHDD